MDKKKKKQGQETVGGSHKFSFNKGIVFGNLYSCIMEYLNNPFVSVIIGIVLVTINDVVGSITSRKFNFSYGYFAIASFFIYTFIGYLVMDQTNYMTITMLSVMLVGVYDGIVGWEISRKLNANYRQPEELIAKMTLKKRISGVILISIVCGWIGILFARL